MRTAPETTEALAAECWCCGAIFAEPDLVRLGRRSPGPFQRRFRVECQHRDGSTDRVPTTGRSGGLMNRTARSLRRTAVLAGAGVAAAIAVMAATAASASTLSLGSVAAGPRVVVGGMSTDQIRTSVAPRSVRPMPSCPSGCSV
jgi:hypothetical protein